ncbi:MAG TPA: hypothetical protein PLP51_03810, partial [Acholeplasmataceae bacterium]|nr:hypothetical protein [Acholeplasmataceae bacterium]
MIIIIWFVVAVFYENLVYGLPLVMAFSYLINSTDLNLKTFSEFLPLLITAILFIAGIIIHIVRFRRKIKVGRLTLGLALMATASLIPFIYVKFSISVFLISLVGIFHLLEYTIFDNYAKIDTKNFIRFLYFLSWLITIQVWTRYTGYLVKNGISSFPTGVKNSWAGFGNLGWGIINDAMIHLLLLMPSHLYYIIKRPKRLA